jgi:hypothetical protein
MPLDAELRELFTGPNVAHVATVMPDGAPHVVPVWIDLEGGRPVFFKVVDSIGHRNLLREPRVAISVTAHDDPYRAGYVRGTVVERRDGLEAGAWLGAQALAYTGLPYPGQVPGPASLFVVELDRAAHRRFAMRPVPEHAGRSSAR